MIGRATRQRCLAVALGLAVAGLLVATTTRARARSPRGTDPFPLRDGSKLRGRTEKIVRVKTAKIVIADYQLLRRDFPQLKDKSDAAIDGWLLEHAGYIAATQAKQTLVNEPIDAESAAHKRARRPRHYGRGLVFEVPGGLLEGKGFGARRPKPGSHSNGLAGLAEVLREYQWHQTLEIVLEHAGTAFKTIRPYAVIDWGFNSKSGGRCGAIIRQAHRRYPRVLHSKAVHLLRSKDALQFEQTVRRYGITSTGAHRGKRFLEKRNLEWINVQADRSGKRIVDLAPFRVLDASFDKRSVANFGSLRPLREAGHQLLQPDPKLRIEPGKFFGGGADGGYDKTWRDAFKLEKAWTSGKIGRREVRFYMRDRRYFVRRMLKRAAP